MKKIVISISLSLFAIGCPLARTLSPQEALARAAAHSDQPAGLSRSAASASQLQMTVGPAETPAAYLFAKPSGGYLLLSANDVGAPVLGYSDSGTLDPANLPPALEYWLECYRSQIERASRSGLTAYSAEPRAEKAPVGPLMTTTWDQGAPYYNECPMMDSKRTYTGCVATAMAQVMKFHEWPLRANENANIKYYWSENNQYLERSFANYEFDWANMLDTYRSGNYTEAEADAVANLMVACGYGVHMGYTPSGSGGSTLRIGSSLVDYYGYDKGIYTTKRYFYSLPEWEDLIYDDLVECGPVVYVGFNDHTGHCFVCDGYQGDGYFHFNWGWSGSSDGYFLLTALDPAQQGIGGSTDGYDSHQNIVLGVRPPVEGSKPMWHFICEGNLSLSATSGTTGSIIVKSNFVNYSSATAVGSFGLRLVSETNGSEIGVLYGPSTGSTYDPDARKAQFSLAKNKFPEGTYRVYPVFRHKDGSITDIRFKADEAGYAIMNKSGSSVLFSIPEVGSYYVTDLQMELGLFQNTNFLAVGDACWSGPESVNRTLYGILYDANGEEIIAVGEGMPQEFPADFEPNRFEYFSKWITIKKNDYKTDGIPVGDYIFAMATEQNGVYTPVSDMIPVTMKENPGDPKLWVRGCEIENATAADPSDVGLDFTLECTSGMLMDNISVAFFSSQGRGNIGQFNTEKIFMNPGTVKYVSARGATRGLPGEKAYVYFFRGGRQLSGGGQPVVFAAAGSTGISDVSADSAVSISVSPNPTDGLCVVNATAGIRHLDLVSVSGALLPADAEISGSVARLDLSALPSGLYIARVTTENGTESVKIIRK